MNTTAEISNLITKYGPTTVTRWALSGEARYLKGKAQRERKKTKDPLLAETRAINARLKTLTNAELNRLKAFTQTIGGSLNEIKKE